MLCNGGCDACAVKWECMLGEIPDTLDYDNEDEKEMVYIIVRTKTFLPEKTVYLRE